MGVYTDVSSYISREAYATSFPFLASGISSISFNAFVTAFLVAYKRKRRPFLLRMDTESLASPLWRDICAFDDTDLSYCGTSESKGCRHMTKVMNGISAFASWPLMHENVELICGAIIIMGTYLCEESLCPTGRDVDIMLWTLHGPRWRNFLDQWQFTGAVLGHEQERFTFISETSTWGSTQTVGNGEIRFAPPVLRIFIERVGSWKSIGLCTS